VHQVSVRSASNLSKDSVSSVADASSDAEVTVEPFGEEQDRQFMKRFDKQAVHELFDTLPVILQDGDDVIIRRRDSRRGTSSPADVSVPDPSVKLLRSPTLSSRMMTVAEEDAAVQLEPASQGRKQ
jgi:hypothetical protein